MNRRPVDDKEELGKYLEQYSLHFSFHDGHISHVCPSPDDVLWSINIKRGILSALQNTMPRFDLSHQSFEVISRF